MSEGITLHLHLTSWRIEFVQVGSVAVSLSSPSAPPEAGLKQTDESTQASTTRFSAEEEQALLDESAQKKTKANELFNAGECDAALVQYQEALESCPDYRHFERAVIHSNVSACQLKLEEWVAAIKAASASLDALVAMERELGLIPEAKPEPAAGKSREKGADAKVNEGENANHPSDGKAEEGEPTGAEPPPFIPAHVPEATKKDIQRIRIKALLRRGRARAEAGGWSNLSAAEEDYKALSVTPGLAPADAQTVRRQRLALPPRTKAAQEQEMTEMWGKLRTLGDGILKPFGLSTNNFQMVKDGATGGYSMNFQGNKES
ncbi:tetratricopeptide repeat protein 1 (TTC1), putative [Cordyceps militaris CM01]|uniref:Tetratricopeptide repeat protein 1 (TTC1), putative n=1 Tax=Cordyceps militaris (strain CM01) TaxID=983644 RepID=G3JKQ8_CORMM|nr:tetratricopeptide repeat protein 1 (TTC1), putative [Cordyceps militaris CM01]EGX91497.1 tetratricopeptide repeat protein 1 (TTC1), putative [Cordyceps militaris CM01]